MTMAFMQMMLHVFVFLVMPTASAAMLHTSSSLRARGVNVASSAVGKEDWWPFNIFGRGGNAKSSLKQKLENMGDSQYFAMIEVGGQKVKAVIDTGSFELLVFGSNCTVCGDEQALYNSSKSGSSTVVDFEATHSFGSGTTHSKEATDTVKIGALSITNQSFWQVYDADMYILSDGNFQAILGVGPPASAVAFAEVDDDEVHNQMKTLKENGEDITEEIKDIAHYYHDMVAYMKNLSSVSANLNITNMSICLGTESESPGYFVWNDDMAQKYPEKFATVRVYGDYYWSSSLGQVHLAGGSVSGENASKQLKQLARKSIEIGCPTGNCSAVIDTGTSLLVAPAEVVDRIYDLADEWQAAGGSCEDVSGLPELRFTLGGVDLALPPEAYMGEVTGAVYDDLATYMPRFAKKYKRFTKKYITALSKKGPNMSEVQSETAEIHSESDSEIQDEWSMCEPLLMSLDAESEFGQLWILGMPFFRKYYTSFQFIQREGQGPEASTMSFSAQDGNCGPGVAPKPFEQLQGKTITLKNTTDTDAGDSHLTAPITPIMDEIPEKPRRRAQLKIDASKILMPNLKTVVAVKKGSERGLA